MGEVEELCERYIEVRGEGCWIPTGKSMRLGKLGIAYEGKRVAPRKLFYRLRHPDYDGGKLFQWCGTPECVSPEHCGPTVHDPDKPPTFEELKERYVREEGDCWLPATNGVTRSIMIRGSTTTLRRALYDSYSNAPVIQPEQRLFPHCGTEGCVNPPHLGPTRAAETSLGEIPTQTLLSRYTVTDEDTGCWLYKRPGQRVFQLRGEKVHARPYLYREFIGEPEGDLHAGCEHERCVNPFHMVVEGYEGHRTKWSEDRKARFLEKQKLMGQRIKEGAEIVPSGVHKGCWEWVGYRDKDGYGRLKVGGVATGDRVHTVGAHRMSFEEFEGEVPEGLQVLHHCDNPSCVNPDHLYAGTHQDNMDDLKERGKGAKKGRPAHISDELIAEIRRRVASGLETKAHIAMSCGVSWSTVDKVSRGQRRSVVH